MCVAQLEQGRAEVENAYTRAVRREGNDEGPRAHRATSSGSSAESGAGSARSRRAASGFARSTTSSTPSAVSASRATPSEEPTECISGSILQGVKKPRECPAFGDARAPPTGRSAPPWCRRKARAPRTIGTAGSRPRQGDVTRGRRTRKNSRCRARYRSPSIRTIVLGHGGGGTLTHSLIEKMFVPVFGNPLSRELSRRRGFRDRPERSSPSRPTRTSCARSSSPAATSGRSR